MSLPLADAIRSKGFTLLGALAFVEKRFGPEGRERVIAALPDADREVCRRSILSSDWVPFRTQVALYETADRVLGNGDLALCREIGRATCEAEMSTINRIFLQMASLETWIRSAGFMWKRYYSVGALRVDGFRPGGGDALISEFNPIHEAFCQDFAGWLERTVELAGHQKAAAVHAACLLKGAPACRYELSWS